jgi:hypothetical protein
MPYYFGFDILTAVTMKNEVFWDVALCGNSQLVPV